MQRAAFLLVPMLAGCHEYSLYAAFMETDLEFAPQPELADDGEVWDDTVQGEVADDEAGIDFDPPEDDIPDDIFGGDDGEGGDDDVDGGSGDVDSAVDDPVFEDCLPGYQAAYFNLPGSHPDVVTAAPGLDPGKRPGVHDWFDAVYAVDSRIDESLTFGADWWPASVNSGEAGDPAHFAVHWRGWFELEAPQTLTFYAASDDDAWAAIDGKIVADQGGIHPMEEHCYSVTLGAGLHRVDIHTADRDDSESGMWFEWEQDLDIRACDDL